MAEKKKKKKEKKENTRDRSVPDGSDNNAKNGRTSKRQSAFAKEKKSTVRVV